jgi:hypothetical protein
MVSVFFPLLLCEHSYAQEKDLKSLSIETGYTVSYKSNMFNFSDDDQDTFDAGTNPNRFKDIESIDDIAHRIHVDPEITANVIDWGKTRFGADISGTFYSENTESNYEKYEFTMKQYFNTQVDMVRIGYEYLPGFFVRNFTDIDVKSGDRFRKAEFDSSSVSAKWWHRFHDNISAWIQYSYGFKDYNSNFNERDTDSNTFDLSVDFSLCPWAEISPVFSAASYDAKGSDGGSVRTDISKDEVTTGAELTLIPTEQFPVVLGYTFTWVDYTTGNSVSEDPFHSGREDEIDELYAKISYLSKKDVKIFVKYQHTNDDASIPSEAVTTSSAEGVLGYDSYTVSGGVDLKF